MPATSKQLNEYNIELTSYVLNTLKKQFKGSAFDAWLSSVEDLRRCGASTNLVQQYAQACVVLAQVLGVKTVFKLPKPLVFIIENAGNDAALSLLENIPFATKLLSTEDEFCSWLIAIKDLAIAAPQQVQQVCRKTQTLLAQLDAAGFRKWLMTGLTSTGRDNKKLDRYFSLQDPASQYVLELESSDVQLAPVEKRISSVMTGLWGIVPTIRAANVKEVQHSSRRTSFDGNFIRLPASFPGYRAEQAESVFKAAITHVGAHIEFSNGRLKPKALKPIQIAIISILEDSRAELLAARKYPGLLNLWKSFHTVASKSTVATEELLTSEKNSACFVVADTAPTTEKLLERLARALIDPDYIDDNPWVKKGRKMFFDAGPDWNDPEDLRRIGVLLGNDLGQMRLQFNAKTYVVQPVYRDDNLGLWDFGDPPDEVEDDPDIVHGSFRIEQSDDPNDSHQKQREDNNAQEQTQTGKVRQLDDNAGIPICKLPEWDYIAASERSDWVTIMEYQAPSAPSQIISQLLLKHANIERQISTLIKQARIGRPNRLRSQLEGDRLDLDACIRTRIDRKAGLSADNRLYETTALLQRDLSVLVLLDISESTKDLINGTTTSIFSIERTATALLAHAMDGVGDPFAIHAFCSNGRDDLHYHRIKDFADPYDKASKSRLAGMKPGLSTRMGAALRYAGLDISQQTTHRRLVMVITDGEPSDIDIENSKYLVEDARKAVHELAYKGIDVFAVGLDGSGEDYLARIFGHRNSMQIDRIESLPEQLPMLYFRLTA